MDTTVFVTQPQDSARTSSCGEGEGGRALSGREAGREGEREQEMASPCSSATYRESMGRNGHSSLPAVNSPPIIVGAHLSLSLAVSLAVHFPICPFFNRSPALGDIQHSRAGGAPATTTIVSSFSGLPCLCVVLLARQSTNSTRMSRARCHTEEDSKSTR